jgi:hypothetical protein
LSRASYLIRTLFKRALLAARIWEKSRLPNHRKPLKDTDTLLTFKGKKCASEKTKKIVARANREGKSAMPLKEKPVQVFLIYYLSNRCFNTSRSCVRLKNNHPKSDQRHCFYYIMFFSFISSLVGIGLSRRYLAES